jgi:hypothetical protein
MFVELHIGLAGAEDDAVDFFRRGDGIVVVFWVGEDPFEVGVAGEVFDGGAGEGVTEEEFREEEDECCRGRRVLVLLG